MLIVYTAQEPYRGTYICAANNNIVAFHSN